MENHDILVLMEVEDFNGEEPDTMSMITFLSQIFKVLQHAKEGPGYQG